MRLGKFLTDSDGNFHGTVRAYGLPETSLVITPNPVEDARSLSSVIGDPLNAAFEAGIAFPKQKGEMHYLSVVLDSPVFPAPVNAALFQDKNNPSIYNLVWDRLRLKSQLVNDATAEEGDKVARVKGKVPASGRSTLAL